MSIWCLYTVTYTATAFCKAHVLETKEQGLLLAEGSNPIYEVVYGCKVAL